MESQENLSLDLTPLVETAKLLPEDEHHLQGEMLEFLRGNSASLPPPAMRMFVNNGWRLSSVLAYTAYFCMPRILRKLNYLDAIERRLFDPDQVETMKEVDLERRYKEAHRQTFAEAEWVRKYCAQNLPSLNTEGGTGDKTFVDYLGTLPKEKLQRLVRKLKTGQISLEDE